jgi:Ca-activated chloride channel homolog
MLFLLVLVPLLVAWYVLQQRRQRQLAAQYGSLGFLKGAAGRTPGLRQHIPSAIFLTGFVVLMVSLARPQAVVSLPKQQGTVMLVFDVSGSMAADDIKPTRLEAAKAAARDFVQRQPASVQIGVVSFSDNGISVQLPTNDSDAILAAIKALTPQRGTSVGSGIQAALNAILVGNGEAPRLYSSIQPTPNPTPTPVPRGTYTPAVIVLLTDGENNESPNPSAAAQLAADRGVRIYTVGVGSIAGKTLKINGFNIHTQLNEAVLKNISQITGGTYYNAQDEQDLRSIYQNLSLQFIVKPEKTEVTSLFAGASILLLLMGGVFSLLWFNRLP